MLGIIKLLDYLVIIQKIDQIGGGEESFWGCVSSIPGVSTHWPRKDCGIRRERNYIFPEVQGKILRLRLIGGGGNAL